jgi:hypothetical protein
VGIVEALKRSLNDTGILRVVTASGTLASMAARKDTKRMIELARGLHRAAQDRHDDFLAAMTANLVKSAERILAKEISPPLVVKREQTEGR